MIERSMFYLVERHYAVKHYLTLTITIIAGPKGEAISDWAQGGCRPF